MFWNGDIQNFSNQRFDGYFGGIRNVARRTLPKNPPREWIALFDKNVAQEERSELALVPANLVPPRQLETSTFDPRDLHLDLPLSTQSTFVADFQPPALTARNRLHYGEQEEKKAESTCSKCSKFQITLLAVTIYLAVAVLVMMITVAILVSTMRDLSSNDSNSGGLASPLSALNGTFTNDTITEISTALPSEISTSATLTKDTQKSSTIPISLTVGSKQTSKAAATSSTKTSKVIPHATTTAIPPTNARSTIPITITTTTILTTSTPPSTTTIKSTTTTTTTPLTTTTTTTPTSITTTTPRTTTRSTTTKSTPTTTKTTTSPTTTRSTTKTTTTPTTTTTTTPPTTTRSTTTTTTTQTTSTTTTRPTTKRSTTMTTTTPTTTTTTTTPPTTTRSTTTTPTQTTSTTTTRPTTTRSTTITTTTPTTTTTTIPHTITRTTTTTPTTTRITTPSTTTTLSTTTATSTTTTTPRKTTTLKTPTTTTTPFTSTTLTKTTTTTTPSTTTSVTSPTISSISTTTTLSSATTKTPSTKSSTSKTLTTTISPITKSSTTSLKPTTTDTTSPSTTISTTTTTTKPTTSTPTSITTSTSTSTTNAFTTTTVINTTTKSSPETPSKLLTTTMTTQGTTPSIPVCDSSVCRSLAETMNSSLNRFVDPCSNFYSYACGKWISTRRALLEENQIETFRKSVRDDKLYTFLEKINAFVSLPILPDESSLSLKQIYQSCLSSNNKDDSSKIWQDMHTVLDPLGLGAELDTDKSIESLQYAAMSEFGTGPLFSLSVGSSMIDKNKKYIIKLHPTTLLLSRAVYEIPVAQSVEGLDYLHQISRILENYFRSNDNIEGARRKKRSFWKTKHGFRSRKLLQEEEGGLGIYSLSINMMFKVFDFERELAKIIPTNQTLGNTPDVKRLRVSDLSGQYPSLNWSAVLNINESSLVELVHPGYFQGLHTLINKTDVKTIKFYIFTRIILQGIWQYLPYSKRGSIDGLGGYEAKKYTWTDCVKFTISLLPSDLHLDYLLTYFQEIDTNRRYITSMIQNMSLLIQENLASFDFLSSETMTKARTKLQQMNIISVPFDFTSRTELSVTEDSFLLRAHSALKSTFERDIAKSGYHVYFTHINWEDMDILYDEETNVMGIPLGFTSKLIQGAPGFYHYSTIGFEIAGQLFRAIFGNMKDYYPLDWWSDSTATGYYDKWTCFLNQTNELRTIDGFYRTGKRISALVAFQKSLEVFQELVLKNLVQQYALPNVSLDMKQLYYTNFAQGLCQTEDYTTIVPAMDIVNNALRQSVGFTTVFQCRSGSYMNPSKRCNI